ncbi:serine hydrolase domain-containing protein [Roseateles cavernae]|uniref:serine hydrolase domain-containing protein n=1 Tax=Roseateles cavernae TaxID=3153578 RepID=UPI0032E3EA23
MNSMKYSLSQLFGIACLALLPQLASAQLDPAAQAAVDRVLADFKDPNRPALAIAVISKGSLIYQQAFGQASLEYKVPATVDTRFHVDKLAWEVIAFAILKLEQEGKVSLSDDVRTYLPALPDFGKPISINHLLSSTDGLHSYRILHALTGAKPTEAGQKAGLPDYIKRQRQANFTPGQAYSSIADTRFLVLQKLVEVVTGQSFDAYCKEQLFEPLGMSNTLFASAAPLSNLATPYSGDPKTGYSPSHGERGAAAYASLYSSIRDMATWKRHVLSHGLAKKLHGALRLDDGTPIRSASGATIYGQQHEGKERGIPKQFQTGSHGGYASTSIRFPEQDFSVIVLSSGLAYNGAYGMRLAFLFLEKHFTEAETIDFTKIEAAKLSAAQLQNIQGSYWSPLAAQATKIHLKDNVLHYSRPGAEWEILPLSAALLQLKIPSDDKFLLQLTEGRDGRQMKLSVTGSDPVVFNAYQPASYTKAELAQFTGTFFNRDLNTMIELVETDGVLTARNLHIGTVNFAPVHGDIFTGDKNFLSGLKFIRTGHAVSSFQILVDGARNLEFTKLRS